MRGGRINVRSSMYSSSKMSESMTTAEEKLHSLINLLLTMTFSTEEKLQIPLSNILNYK